MPGKTSRTAKVHEQDYVVRAPPAPNKIGHLPWVSTLSPSGLVPCLCSHGLAALPPDHPQFAFNPRRDKAGGELPRFAGHSWVRSRYVMLDFRCIVCHGEPRPDDLTEARAWPQH